jgi:hypothetical protein
MKLKTAAVALIVGALSLFGAGISCATEQQEHVAKALTHAQTAVNEGQKGMANAVGQHAYQALEHAKQAEELKPDPHITEAETHLRHGIDHAATGHADIAIKSGGGSHWPSQDGLQRNSRERLKVTP